MRTFQTILLAIFGFFIVGGIIAIATFGKLGGGTSTVAAQAAIWGTLDSTLVNGVVSDYNNANNNVLQVTYTQLSPDEFDSKLINALAAGGGPDAVILSQGQLAHYQDKLYTIPFSSISERLFRDTYTQGSEIFMTSDGILGLPILIDPLVMYWNRTLLNGARIAKPPVYWDELVDMGKTLTKSDTSFNILQSVIALGEYRNITHAKEILATLIQQAGDPITLRDAGGRIGVTLGDDFGLPEAPADSALRFYTEFANPVKPVYSWNRSLPASQDVFIRGDLALYLGFGSELTRLQERNPNLNFDIAPIPQIRDASLKSTSGTIYGIAMVKQSKNIAGAFQAITILTGKDAATLWADKTLLSPARRDLLAVAPADPYRAIFFKEALIVEGFLDPEPTQTGTIFQDLVENITSGRTPISRAVDEAGDKIEQLFK